MMKLFYATTLLVSLAAARVWAADLPACFVAPFGGDTTAIQFWQPAMGAGLGEMLTTELGKINKFQMLEVSQLQELKNEINLGEDGWVDQNQKVDKGGFSAADFMFTAKVTKFGNKQQKIGLGGFGGSALGALGIKTTTADVRIDWRLVDVATRKIIKTGSAEETQKGLGFSIGGIGGGAGGLIGFDNSEFMDSALGKATVRAMATIVAEVRAIPLPESGRVKQKSASTQKASAATQAVAQAAHSTPGKVLAIAGKDSVIISLGTKQGFKNGDKLNLYETVDTKDDKGNVVFSDEKLVGEVTISAAQEDRSRAAYAGDLIVQQGWVVKGK
jgi:curli biogenesis system outer membrane secretion channel CsgG